MTKNADIDKYRYKNNFLFTGGGFGQNVIIFGTDMSSSVHVDNKKKDILILGSGPTLVRTHTDCRKNIFH